MQNIHEEMFFVEKFTVIVEEYRSIVWLMAENPNARMFSCMCALKTVMVNIFRILLLISCNLTGQQEVNK